MLKSAIKHGAGEDQVRHRIVPPEVVSKWSQRLESLKDEVSAVLRDEKQEKQVSEFHALMYSFRPYLTDDTASTGRNGA
jgi:hypothetical protein